MPILSLKTGAPKQLRCKLFAPLLGQVSAGRVVRFDGSTDSLGNLRGLGVGLKPGVVANHARSRAYLLCKTGA